MNPSTSVDDHGQHVQLTPPERPLALTQSLFLRDFLHEIGQCAGLLAIMERALVARSGVIDTEDNRDPNPDPDWLQRYVAVVAELRGHYQHYRAIGTVWPPTISPRDQWHTLTQRVLHLTHLSVERAGAVIRFVEPSVVESQPRDLAALELVILCFLKETLDQRPAGAPATFLITLAHEGPPGFGAAHTGVTIAVHDDSLALTLRVPAVASLVAERLGLVITRAADGQSSCVAVCSSEAVPGFQGERVL
jgi:hypothetical protein